MSSKSEIAEFKRKLMILPQKELEENMIAHHIDSMNEFYTNGIKQIITSTFTIALTLDNKRTATQEDLLIDKFHVSAIIHNVSIKKPQSVSLLGSVQTPLMPNEARKYDLTYQSVINASATIEATAFKKNGEEIRVSEKIDNFKICAVPTMVKSCLCNLNGFTNEMLISHDEDPDDKGGYFIIKGLEWTIDNMENIVYNSIRCYRNVGYKNELARAEIISKPGDAFENSSEIIAKMITNDQIICVMINDNMTKDNNKLEIPFYMIFRLLGITRDEDIIKYIVLDLDSPIGKLMQPKLEKAMTCSYTHLPKASICRDRISSILYLAQTVDVFKNNYNDFGEIIGADQEAKDNTKKYVVNRITDILNKNFLPHIGLTSESNIRKARYFGHLIHKLILTEMQIIQSTDRDAYDNKRVHPPGVSYSKSFKSLYGQAIANEIKRAFKTALTSTTFKNIVWKSTFMSAVSKSDFEKALSQAITRSDSKIPIGPKTFRNHISAQLLNRKNPLNVFSSQRTITSGGSNNNENKSSTRAHDRRQVNGSYAGYICPHQSADTGSLVGMKKQMAISTSVTRAGISFILKDKVLSEPEVMPVDKVSSKDIYEFGLTKIMVNGEWVGLVRDGFAFITKFRNYRRNGIVDMHMSIQWDFILNEVVLWVDVGRIIRPLLIVYNNEDDRYDQKPVKSTGKFHQGIMITNEHLKKMYADQMNNEDLRKARIIEYISPEEQSRLLIATSYSELRENENNHLIRYTHCEIEQATFGLAALTAPFSNSDQLTRLCYHTNQIKAACSWFAKNWKSRHDKETFLQYYLETPLCRTITNKFFTACGTNVIVAVMLNGGYNQEDSIIFNQDSLRRGLFKGSYMYVERIEKDPKEIVGNPNSSTTSDFTSAVNYGKIVDGLIPEGSIIDNNDVIIGKYVPNEDENSNYKFIDQSVVYQREERAIIEKVEGPNRNQADAVVYKVATRSVRDVNCGDKFTSRHGQKGVCGVTLPQEEMPFTEDGLVPDLIINPHYLPTRMTIGQVKETMSAMLAAIMGHTVDGTVFNDIDLDEIGDKLEEVGFNRHGESVMYCGETGRKIDTTIFIGPTYYSRLQKFVLGALYAVNSGPTSAVTKQPVAGRNSHGGMRLGEMERDVITGNGATMTLAEKFGTHSDGSVIYICKRCGSKDGVVVSENLENNIIKCKNCGDLADVVRVNTCTATNVFMHHLSNMNIDMKFTISGLEFVDNNK